MRRRRFLGSLAGMLLLAGSASSPARGESLTFPSVPAQARTVDGAVVGSVRVQLRFEDGAFRHGGKTWACKYTYHVEFDSIQTAWVTALQPSSCGHAYSLDATVRGKEWDTSTWFNLNSRLLTFSTLKTSDAIPPFGTGDFTGFSNAGWGVGSITVRGLVQMGGILQEWSAELLGHTMGCDLRNAPPEPVVKLGLSTSKSPVGTGETVGVTLLISNEGGAVAESVLITMDPIGHSTYVPESGAADGEPLPDVDGGPAVINGGLLATVAPGETITVSHRIKINDNAGGQTLKLAAHAELDGYPKKTVTTDVPIVQLRWPKLSMSMSVSSDPVGTGEVLTATWELKNSGDGDAKHVLVTLEPVQFATYVPGSTRVNGVQQADVNGKSALDSGLEVNVPAGGVTTISWSGKVHNNAGGQKLYLRAEAELAGHEDLYAGTAVTVVEAIPAAFESLIATIDAAQAAGAFRFKVTGHYLFNNHAQAAFKAWKAGNKKTAISNLERIMFLATWRGRFGLTPELFYEGSGTNWAGQINTAAKKVRDLIQAS